MLSKFAASLLLAGLFMTGMMSTLSYAEETDMFAKSGLPIPDYGKMAEVLSQNPEFRAAWEAVTQNETSRKFTEKTVPEKPSSDALFSQTKREDSWKNLFQSSQKSDNDTFSGKKDIPVPSRAEIFLTFDCGFCGDFMRNYIQQKDSLNLLDGQITICLLPKTENDVRITYVFNRLMKRDRTLAENFLYQVYENINTAVRGDKDENLAYLDQWLQKNVGEGIASFMRDMKEEERDAIHAVQRAFEGYGAAHVPLLVIDGKVIDTSGNTRK